MIDMHIAKSVSVGDLFGFEVVPGANPGKTVLRRKGDEENASYVLLDGVQPDAYHAFAHAVQAAGEACQWADMENYVRFGLAGEQDRPAREVLVREPFGRYEVKTAEYFEEQRRMFASSLDASCEVPARQQPPRQTPSSAERSARDQAAATKAASTQAKDRDKALKPWERTNHF